MSDSETSSDINLNIVDSNGRKIDLFNNDKKEEPKKINSSTTDMYFNMLSNKSKEVEQKIDDTTSNINSTSSDTSTINSSTSSASSSIKSKKSYSSIKLNKENTSETNKSKFEPKIKMSYNDLKMKKIELLRKLSEIKAKGYDLSKKYDFNSNIEEMEYEYQLLKSFANKRNGIKLYKNILLNTASAIEFLNDKYDPFSFKLNGWSEHMSVEVDNYDEVLEELYEKYKGTGKKMPPEFKLFLLILASASAFHFTKSYAQSSVIESMMKNNPNMVSNLLNSKKPSSQFMTPQEINLERQRDIAKQREKLQRESLKHTYQNNYNPANQMNPMPPAQVNIKAPSNVKEILERLHASDNNSIEKANNRLVSESTITTDTNGEKKKRGRKKKTIMSIL